MSWEYRQLKRRLAMPADPLLELFEGYCESAGDTIADMEWSCKVVGRSIQADRFAWLGRPDRARQTARNVARLLREVGFSPTGLPGGIASFRDLLENHAQCTLVGYAGPSEATGRAAMLKVYLTFGARSLPDIYPRLLKPCLPELPDGIPPGEPTVLLGYSLDARGVFEPRVYVFYGEDAYREPSVCRFVEPMIGERGLALMRIHPRSGLSLKRGGTDMMGIGLRPTGLRDISHPSHILSPLLVPLRALAREHAVLAERLDRVTWISVPLGFDAWKLESAPAEMNIYMRIH